MMNHYTAVSREKQDQLTTKKHSHASIRLSIAIKVFSPRLTMQFQIELSQTKTSDREFSATSSKRSKTELNIKSRRLIAFIITSRTLQTHLAAKLTNQALPRNLLHRLMTTTHIVTTTILETNIHHMVSKATPITHTTNHLTNTSLKIFTQTIRVNSRLILNKMQLNSCQITVITACMAVVVITNMVEITIR